MKRRNQMAAVAAAGMFVLAGMSVQAEEQTGGLTNEAVLYDANGVTVTGILEKDSGNGDYHLNCQVKNSSEYPVLLQKGKVIANDVVVGGLDDDVSEIEVALEIAKSIIDEGISETLEEELKLSDITYVLPGEEKPMDISVDEENVLQKVFSYESIQKLQVSLSVLGLKEVPDESDLTFSDEDYAFAEDGELTEFEVLNSTWDGTWKEIEGSVLYEDDQIRVIDGGVSLYENGSLDEFVLVLENHSESRVELEEIYEGREEINGQVSPFAYVYPCMALPGTRIACGLSMDMPDSWTDEEISSAYCEMSILNGDTYETIGNFNYVYGDGDQLPVAVETKKLDESEEKTGNASGVVIENQTIYDEEGIRIQTTGTGTNWQGKLELHLEVSNSTDKGAYISFAGADGETYGDGAYCYINGYQIPGTAYMQVAAGETLDDVIYLDTPLLKLAGIDNVGEIELALAIEDNDNGGTLAPTRVVQIPVQLEEEMDTELGENMQKLAEENGFTLCARYAAAEETGDDPGYVAGYVIMAIRNDSESAAKFHVNTLTVNGSENSQYFYGGMENPGKTQLAAYPVYKDFMNENAIESVESLSLNVWISGTGEDVTPIVDWGQVSIPMGEAAAE